MQRIYAGVFGSGLGHVSRTYSIVSELRKQGNYEFLFSTFDEALELLRKYQEPVIHSPSVGVQWNFAGGFSGRDTLVHFPIYLFTFSHQVAFESNKISSFNPRAVLSDSRLSTIVGAKSRFYPVVTVLNQFKILFPPRFRQNRLSRLFERIEGDFLGLIWTLSNEVLFPDLPAPYTLGGANIEGTDVAGKVRFTGFMNPKISSGKEELDKVRRVLEFDNRPIVFIQISGPEPTKPHFVDTAMRSAQILSEKYNVVVSKGISRGTTTPSKIRNGAWLYEWCPIKDQLFLLSDTLVARAGHTTISQCIEYAKPAVIVPIYNHSEQLWNAKKFVKMGLGIEIRSEELRTDRLVKAVESCQEDYKFKGNAERLKSISDRYNGLTAAVEIVKEFL